MNDMEPKRTGWTLVRGAWVGFVLGALIPGAIVFPEVAKRFVRALGGGRGEGAAWGEPLFYWVLLGLPAGLIGTVGGVLFVLLAAVIRWILKHK